MSIHGVRVLPVKPSKNVTERSIIAPLIGLPEPSSLFSSEREKNEGLWALISIAGRYAESCGVGGFSGFIDVGETRLLSA
jgi:hypothetical protein